MALSLSKLVRKDLPYGGSLLNLKRLEKLSQKILGKNYNLSIVVTGDKKIQNLNKKYRQKNYVPNVLSFNLDSKNGEIFLNLNRIKIESKKFEMSEKEFFIYLIIHSLLHLKGLDHSNKMDKLEEKYLKDFLYTENNS